MLAARDLPAVVTAAEFDAMRPDLRHVRAFLQRMPKGGDLHMHLSGAVYAERLIAWAVADKQCLRKSDMTILPRPDGAAPDAPCGADPAVVPIAEAVAGWRGQTTYDLLVNALSTRWFVATPAVPSGHDQFFASFSKFNAATGGADWAATLDRLAEMTVDQLRQYDADHVQYAEMMVTLFEGDDRRWMAKFVAAAAGPDGVLKTDPAALLAAIEAHGLADMVAARVKQLSALKARIDEILACGGARERPGCGVTFRYIAQINRNGPPDEVFAQTALSAALVRAMPELVVGLNYVGPEDYRTARDDYRTHMRWVGFLTGKDVPVALHAGELWLGLVPPPDLTFHIRDAVETAGARRIGHGTAISFEKDMEGLLAEMRRRDVAVEIALTSSDVILGIRGREHPITTYLAAGVPVTLATDDAGVSRIDLANEYVRAARDHGIGYAQLKAFAHSALTHSFLPDADKKQELARLDAAFAAFEAEISEAQTWPRKLGALLRAAVLPGR